MPVDDVASSDFPKLKHARFDFLESSFSMLFRPAGCCAVLQCTAVRLNDTLVRTLQKKRLGPGHLIDSVFNTTIKRSKFSGRNLVMPKSKKATPKGRRHVRGVMY
jgi:hypothetical protein